jgi:hypothetical protein
MLYILENFMSHTFKINGQDYISMSFNTSFDQNTKELAFFIYDSTKEDRAIFLENKNMFKLKLINVRSYFFILESNNIKYAFEFNNNKELIKDLFLKKELEIGFAFEDNNNNLITELCFTVDY